MQQMQQWLDEAKVQGMRKALIFFHYPVFARSGLGPIPDPDNPHKIMVVFNGHVHTTEIYEVDGVKYLMLGGGGAEQDPILPGHSHVTVPVDYPPDLYWKGAPRQEEYNYAPLSMSNSERRPKFTLNRYRPPVFQGHEIGCERCHGPGELHVAHPEIIGGRDMTIVNPASLAPSLRDAVCEQCHLQGEKRVLRRG